MLSDNFKKRLQDAIRDFNTDPYFKDHTSHLASSDGLISQVKSIKEKGGQGHIFCLQREVKDDSNEEELNISIKVARTMIDNPDEVEAFIIKEQQKYE